jgi:hypothetical protein
MGQTDGVATKNRRICYIAGAIGGLVLLAVFGMLVFVVYALSYIYVYYEYSPFLIVSQYQGFVDCRIKRSMILFRQTLCNQ